jgi:hypothetical protein
MTAVINTDPLDLADKARIEQGLVVRDNIITELLKGGAVPKDREDRELLMRALEGRDNTILKKAKIKSDDAAAKSQAAQADMIGNFLNKMNGPLGIQPRSRPAVLENDVIDVVPGETDIGTLPVTYKSIMSGEQQH